MAGLGFLVALLVVGTTIWVGIDASKRDWSDVGYGTAGWVFGCVLLWIVFFPLYLSRRNRAPLKSGTATAVGHPPQAAMYRECPHCKESMRRDADTCPHCRQHSTPWRFHEGRWWFRASPDGVWQWLDERTRTWIEPTNG